MDIICPNCKQCYHIDDEKAPKEGGAHFKCQKCNKTITVTSTAATYQQKIDKTYDAPINNEILPPDAKAALIYSHEQTIKNKIIEQLDKSGYETREADNIKKLREKLKYNIYHVIVITAKETSQDKEEWDFFKDINSLSPDIRRQILLIYILPDGNRSDLLTAFSFGVDLLIRPADISTLDKIIQDAHESKKIMYKIFQECKIKAKGGLSATY